MTSVSVEKETIGVSGYLLVVRVLGIICLLLATTSIICGVLSIVYYRDRENEVLWPHWPANSASGVWCGVAVSLDAILDCHYCTLFNIDHLYIVSLLNTRGSILWIGMDGGHLE